MLSKSTRIFQRITDSQCSLALLLAPDAMLAGGVHGTLLAGICMAFHAELHFIARHE